MLSDIIGCAAMALAAVLPMYAWRLRAPLGADEGYLWYGVQQLRARRIPHRDFKSYEPGRYLWCGALSLVAGEGLAALRAATHLFFAVALAAALLVMHRFGFGWISLGAAAMALGLWSHPQHKQFEHGCLLAAWASQALLLWQATPLHFVLAFGVCGLLLVVGFNLFLYAGAALALELAVAVLLGWISPEPESAAIAAFALLAGAAPFLLLLASPGFRRNFWRRRIGSVLTRGTANLPLPKPWPWARRDSHLPGGRRRAYAWLFLFLFALPLLGLGIVLAIPLPRPVGAGMLAAAALAALATHHAASRADASHMAQSIAPALLLGLVASHWLAPSWGALAIAMLSAWLAWPLLMQARAADPAMRWRCVGGLRIRVPASVDALLDRATALVAAEIENRSGLYLAPAYPALYAMLGRKAAAYDTFSLYPADDASQAAMIRELRASGVFAALVSNDAFDGREDLRFARTHPRIWEFLQSEFSPSVFPEAGPDVWQFVARAAP